MSSDTNNQQQSSSSLYDRDHQNDKDDFDLFYDYAKGARVDRSGYWTEQNWQDEMEKHPLFTTKLPEPSEEQPELIEALSQLKYDPQFNSIEELVDSYRQDGNENFYQKRYRWSVDSYSEGIRLAHEHFKTNTSSKKNKSLNQALSVLYSNRASAHFHLKNYRSSMQDATRSLILNPQNHKSILRFGQCCFELKKFEQCLNFCQQKLKEIDQLELEDKTIELKLYKDLMELVKKTQKSLKIQNRDQRKMARVDQKRSEEHQKIEEAVRQRGIRFSGSLFETDHSAAWGHFVHFDENSETLIWPIVFIYPETGQTDFIENFHESSKFYDYIEMIFSTEQAPEWDPDRRFRPETIQCFYHSYQSYIADGDQRFHLELKQFDPNLRLLDVLQYKDFLVQNALPTFVLRVD